jgi:hypothetical protein
VEEEDEAVAAAVAAAVAVAVAVAVAAWTRPNPKPKTLIPAARLSDGASLECAVARMVTTKPPKRSRDSYTRN